MRTIERSTHFKRDYKREARGRYAATLDADLVPLLIALAKDEPIGITISAATGLGTGTATCGRTSC